MILKKIYLILIGLIALSSFTVFKNNQTINVCKLITTKSQFEAGQTIVLKFNNPNTQTQLYCSNSYGSTLINPTISKDILNYKIPTNFCSKKGVLNWTLVYGKKAISGLILIKAKNKVSTIETYIGPPSILAGEKDFAMLVAIPIDSLDNPFPDNTKITIKHQFLNIEEEEEIYTKNLISYKNIYSKKKNGRILVSSECLQINSKEHTVIAYPDVPVNFNISAERDHNYADGNQITTFRTSIIKDINNNTIVDGTYVTFYITTKNKTVLKTSGTTINGIATGKIIHPESKNEWKIKAYIDGMAESNFITLNYKQVITDFNVNFSKKNNSITIGPLQSFMKQMIPDGLNVSLSIYNDNKLVTIKERTSYNGYVTFNLNPKLYAKENYTFKIETAGLEKTFNTNSKW